MVSRFATTIRGESAISWHGSLNFLTRPKSHAGGGELPRPRSRPRIRESHHVRPFTRLDRPISQKCRRTPDEDSAIESGHPAHRPPFSYHELDARISRPCHHLRDTLKIRAGPATGFAVWR